MVAINSGQEAEAKAKQRDNSKRATFAALSKKKKAEKEVPIFITGDKMTLLFRALGSTEYDILVSKHPPTKEQKADDANFNMDTFGPALISKVCIEPELTYEQVTDMWNAPEWSRGDLMYLFTEAVEINNRGFDVPFSERV